MRLKAASAESPSSPSEAQRALAETAKKAATCTRCSLAKSRIQVVFGTGSAHARLMFVGEGPGFEEDRIGEPFVGRAGQLLDSILRNLGTSRQEVYIANVVKCHPMRDPSRPDLRGNDRPPSEEEIAACFGWLARQIEIIRPKVICCLGGTAAKTLLRTTEGITRMRGQVRDWPARGSPLLKIVPTYHPAAILRNPDLGRFLEEDIRKAYEISRQES